MYIISDICHKLTKIKSINRLEFIVLPTVLYTFSVLLGIYNTSVTFALRRVYDARTMSKSPFPYDLRRETLRSSYGFTGIVAYRYDFV